MARRWSLPAVALVAALATTACGGNNEDEGMQGTTDATPGNTLDGGAGVSGGVSADTSTAKTATGPAAPQTDSASSANAAAGVTAVQTDSAGGAPAASQPASPPQP